MPGIVGYFSKNDLQFRSEKSNMSIADKTPVELFRTPNALLNGYERNNTPVSLSYHDTPDKYFALFGHCFDRDSFSEIKARQLDELLQQKDLITVLNRLEGAFHAVLLNKEKNELTLVNDRLGILPLYWTIDADSFRFGYDISSLGRYGLQDLNREGLFCFLIAGYCLGTSTLFEKISYLGPATILKADLTKFKVSLTNYWRMRYNPDRNISTKSLACELNGAVLESIRLLCPSDSRAHAGIFLSGGWDSKGLLGGMMATGSGPKRAITNGEDDRLAFSDTNTAKKIAAKYGIPCVVNLKNTALCEDRSLQGLQQCELITDTSPEVFGQHKIAPELFTDLDYILKGDEVWGWQDYAYNRNQGIGHVMPNSIPSRLSALIKDYSTQDIWEAYSRQIDQLVPDQDFDNHNEFKDMLYMYGRVNRYIFGLGRSDEEHIQVRRPYLTKMVLDVIARIPNKLRVQKNLYKEMMIRNQPDLVAFGTSYTSSIPNYYYHMRPLIQRRMKLFFEKNTDFNGLLNLDACRALIDGFAPSITEKKAPSQKMKLRKTIENRAFHLLHRTGLYQKRVAKSWECHEPSDERLAFRLWLLTEFFYHNSIEPAVS